MTTINQNALTAACNEHQKLTKQAKLENLTDEKRAAVISKVGAIVSVYNDALDGELEVSLGDLSAEEIYKIAFEAGKNYALQCAFQGVTDEPANPYAGE